jgi:AraC-like DNA-binding protein
MKAWMKLQECSDNFAAVHVLEPDLNIEPWDGSEMHPIPTLVLSVDLHMRIKTSASTDLDLNAREAVAIRPGALHQHLKSRHLGMHYSQGFMETYSDFRLTDQEEIYRGSANREPLWDMFHGIMDEKDPEKRCSLLGTFIQSVNGDGLMKSEREHPAADRMHEFIRLNAHHDVSMENVIKASGLAEAQAFAVYRKSYGLSPMQHLLKRRVYMAQAYLRSGMRLSEVASKSGFQSGRQMNRAFHRFEGMSPRSWLQKLRKEQSGGK